MQKLMQKNNVKYNFSKSYQLEAWLWFMLLASDFGSVIFMHVGFIIKLVGFMFEHSKKM